MVVKRSCSFCAGEIEPGTGMMFVKRDGTVYHFCSGSCRKQQLGLGRVGHRVRWTHAHAVKRAAALANAPSAAGAPAATPKAAEPKAVEKSAPPSDEKAESSSSPAEPPAKPAKTARKPRAKKPAEP